MRDPAKQLKSSLLNNSDPNINSPNKKRKSKFPPIPENDEIKMQYPIWKKQENIQMLINEYKTYGLPDQKAQMLFDAVKKAELFYRFDYKLKITKDTIGIALTDH